MLKSGAAELILNDELSERFPDVPYDYQPLGNRVFVQVRYPRLQSKGGIQLEQDTIDNAYHNEQVAIVREMGGSCFIFETTGQPWSSGRLFEVGSYVRVPLHGGDNQWRIAPDGKKILFKQFKDYEILGIHKDPIAVPTNYAYF